MLRSFGRIATAAAPARRIAFDMTIGLSETQKEIQQVALDFANKEMAPFAATWDEKHICPTETLQKAAGLGFGGIYVRDDIGGSGLGRKDAAVIFEALSTSCVSTTALLTIHS